MNFEGTILYKTSLFLEYSNINKIKNNGYGNNNKTKISIITTIKYSEIQSLYPKKYGLSHIQC